MLSTEELIKEISGKSGKGESDIKQMIEEKQDELSGLVSAEGAAYIVGRELGVEMIRDTQRELKIKNVLPDMRSVNLVARVMNVFEPKEFESKGKKGMVASLILADETGTIRLPLWNEEVKLLSAIGIAQDDLVEISNAWTKVDKMRDTAELRLGKRGRIKKLEAGDRPEMGEVHASPAASKGNGKDRPLQAAPAQRMNITDVRPGINVQVKGCLVQAYKKKPYFEVCPNCGSRAEEKEGKFVCKDHGAVQPSCILLLSGVIDDGTGNIRAVFFREQAERMFGKSPDQVHKEFDPGSIESFWEGFTKLGQEFVIDGLAKMNDFSQETEILVNGVADVNVKEECRKLLKALSES